MPFTIAVKSKMFNGPLVKLLQETGMSQVVLSEKLGIPYGLFNAYVTMRTYPRNEEHMKVLCDITGMTPDELFPEFLKNPSFLKANKTAIRFKEVDITYLPQKDIEEIAYSDEVSTDCEIENEQTSTAIEKALDCLTERKKSVLKNLYLSGDNERSLEDVGNVFNIGRDRVRQLKDQGLREIVKPLKKYLDLNYEQ